MAINADFLVKIIGKQQVMIEQLQAKLQEIYAERAGTPDDNREETEAAASNGTTP